MAKALITDDLWALIEPEIPKPQRHFWHPGRKRLDDRAVLTGIIFVLKTSIPWEDLPQEMGCGSGMTCWRRLREWQEQGVWDRIHRVLLDHLREADQIDFDRAAVDSASIRALKKGPKSARTRRTDASPAASITC